MHSRNPAETQLTAEDWVEFQDGQRTSDVVLNPHSTDTPYLIIRPMDDRPIKGRSSKEGITTTTIIIIIII